MGIERIPLCRGAVALLACAAFLLAVPAAAQGQKTHPGTPQNVKVTAEDARLTLTWQAPASWGSFAKSSYQGDWRIGTSGVAPVDTDMPRYATTLPMSDCEAALQVAAARACNARHIVTRNLSDYRLSPIPAISPQEAVSDLLL